MNPRLSMLAAVTALAAAGLGQPANAVESSEEGVLTAVNRQLESRGLAIRAEAIHYFTIGKGRPSNRVHQEPFQWVAGDPRRAADGDNVTYLVDESDGATASGLTAAATTAAVDRSMSTWNRNKCTRKVDIIRRSDNGSDPDLFDSLFSYGGFGDPFLADIVSAGWLPRDYFEAVGGPGGGDSILAFSVSFIFVNNEGVPTDINGDGYMDTALNEVYYNDTFGDPRARREGNPWAINGAFPAVDVETVALHENGHSLGLGHFGPQPTAVMNPRYHGVVHEPEPTDTAGLCTVWAQWPR